MVQKSKKWPLMRKNYVSISESAYIIWLCFFLHKFKTMTSPDAFFHFLKILVFWVVRGRGLKGQKMAQNNIKICLTSYLRKCTSYDCGFWYTYVKWYLHQIFSLFQKPDFLGFSKFINKCQKEILRCTPPSSHVFDFFVKLGLILSQYHLYSSKADNIS